MAFNGQGEGSALLLTRFPKSGKSGIMKSAIQLKKSGIPLKWNPESYLEPESTVCLRLPYMGKRQKDAYIIKHDFFTNRCLGTTCKGCT